MKRRRYSIAKKISGAIKIVSANSKIKLAEALLQNQCALALNPETSPPDIIVMSSVISMIEPHK